mmetsp:Transcript_57282/g.153379  ORF Transcript_57282/g.153379 Transcript_57282/m.153379 type:complete len:201 (-) Transcript_57282:308-910(-)
MQPEIARQDAPSREHRELRPRAEDDVQVEPTRVQDGQVEEHVGRSRSHSQPEVARKESPRAQQVVGRCKRQVHAVKVKEGERRVELDEGGSAARVLPIADEYDGRQNKPPHEHCDGVLHEAREAQRFIQPGHSTTPTNWVWRACIMQLQCSQDVTGRHQCPALHCIGNHRPPARIPQGQSQERATPQSPNSTNQSQSLGW